LIEKIGEGERRSTAVWDNQPRQPPPPFKEQKSAQVIEKKEADFCLVQKSEGMMHSAKPFATTAQGKSEGMVQRKPYKNTPWIGEREGFWRNS